MARSVLLQVLLRLTNPVSAGDRAIGVCRTLRTDNVYFRAWRGPAPPPAPRAESDRVDAVPAVRARRRDSL